MTSPGPAGSGLIRAWRLAFFAAVLVAGLLSSTEANAQTRILTIHDPYGGTISGPGIDCGGGATDCTETLALGTVATLTATPEDGFVFVAWTHPCGGESTGTVTMFLDRTCTAVFNRRPGSGGVDDPTLAAASFYINGGGGYQPRRAGLADRYTFSVAPYAKTPVGRDWILASAMRNGGAGEDTEYYTVLLGSGPGSRLAPGTYEGATWNGTTPVMSVNIPGRNCVGTGRFVIHELTYSAPTVISAFAADFEYQCPDAQAPVIGSFRFQSSRPSLIPFGQLTPSVITSPVPGSMLPGADTTFIWDEGIGITGYWVDIGWSQGGTEHYSNFVGPWHMFRATSLPTDGRDVWFRLRSFVNGSYVHRDFRFVAYRTRPAEVTSPAPGSFLTLAGNPYRTFRWDAGVGVSGYWVDFGSTQGGYEYYSNYVGLSQNITLAVPTLNGPVWLRLRSLINGTWEYRDYQYSTPVGVPARLIQPGGSPEFQLTSNVQGLVWDGGVGVTDFWVTVGKTLGGYDVFAGYAGNYSARSFVVPVPVYDGPVFIRLHSRINGIYYSRDYQFRAAVARAATTVRLDWQTWPSGLVAEAVFTWDPGLLVSGFRVDVGTTRGGTDYFSNDVGSQTTLRLQLPRNGQPLWIRVHSLINGEDRFIDREFVHLPAAEASYLYRSPHYPWSVTSTAFSVAWKGGYNLRGYWLDVGTSPGDYSIYSNYIGDAPMERFTISGLPIGPGEVCIRLWSLSSVASPMYSDGCVVAPSTGAFGLVLK